MSEKNDFDYRRYIELINQATDEEKRLALIELLIEERAKDRLAAHLAGERAAITTSAIARVLGSARPRNGEAGPELADALAE